MAPTAHRLAVAATGFALVALVVACATPILTQSLFGAPPVANVRRAFDGLSPTSTSSGVSLFLDNADSWAARWELVAAAERSIDASYFIVEDDIFGATFLAHLYAKARQGVHVRLMLDGRGSASLTLPLFGRDLLQELAATGNVEVYVFNPPMTQLLRSLWERSFLPISSGTHQKTLVVDDQLALTGGRNLSRAYFGATHEERAAMVDADVLLDGPAVQEVRASMERDLQSATVARIWPDVVNLVSQHDELMMLYAAMDSWVRGAVPASPPEQALSELEAKAVAALAAPPVTAEREHVRGHLAELVRAQAIRGKVPVLPQPRHQAEVKVVASASRADQIDDAAVDAFVRALGGARRRVVLVSPYFVITPRLQRAFELASRRGVAITLLTNSPVSSDNAPAEAMFFDTWPEIEARVPTLRIFAKRTRHLLHRKLATFDDGLSFAGTFNLDPFSMHMNSETIVAVWSEAFNQQLRDEADRLLAGGEFIEYRIVRDANGRARRYPPRHPKAGRPVVAYGPRDHVPPKDIEGLEALRELLLSIRGAWDFQIVTD